MIGLPSKDGEEKPQFDNEKLLYRALLEPAFFNSDIIPLPRADTIVKREKRRREAAKSTYADFKNKHLWVKKATGLGVTEFMRSQKNTKSNNDKAQYVCSYCQCNLAKINEDEWYCNRCSISQYPKVEDVRSKSRITTPIGPNLEPCLSYAPDLNESSFAYKTPEIKGGLAELKRRGLKITNFTETDGACRPLKKNRWT